MNEMGSEQVRFVANRRIEHGFSGWESPPTFNEFAKKLLCRNPTKFHEVYGDYFVLGYVKGANLKIEVTSNVKDTSKEEAISASLDASWSGFGAEASVKGSFKSELSQSSHLSNNQ